MEAVDRVPHSPFGRSKLKLNRQAAPRPFEATLNDFSGGLDLTDSDLKLKTNFAKVLNNINRDVDGTLSVRWGTRFKWDVTGVVAGNIIEQVYFRDKIVCFMDSGEICTVAADGTITAIWNDTIAYELPGNPDGWSADLTVIDTTEFKNELVVCNGDDKPILISKTHTVTYLQDIPTGSNVFTPIGKFCTTVGNFCVVAGIDASPDELYISSAGTSGTWPGDDAPNDATSINISAYSADTGGDLRGLSSFRNLLLVHFATSTVVLVLGEYTETTHVPRVLDTISKQGIVSHRMSVAFNEEVITADEKGVFKSIRNVFGTGLESEKFSGRVQPDYIAKIPSTAAGRLASFTIQNDNENRLFFFLKQTSGYEIYTLSYDDGFKRRAWGTYSGWDWTCGCSTVKGRVFFASGSKIYQLGNGIFADEDYTGELMFDDSAPWDIATSYVVGDKVTKDEENYICLEDHTSGVFADDLDLNYWEVYEGEPIEFDWELPWTDTNTRMKKKKLSYIGIDTSGEASFNVQAYVDNFRYDEDGLDDPAIEINFVAGSSQGYGGGNNPYFGGGRRAADERLWGFPCEFKILKLRVKGSTTRRLKMIALTLLYVRGTYKR
jgi:hypothetical protein